MQINGISSSDIREMLSDGKKKTANSDENAFVIEFGNSTFTSSSMSEVESYLADNIASSDSSSVRINGTRYNLNSLSSDDDELTEDEKKKKEELEKEKEANLSKMEKLEASIKNAVQRAKTSMMNALNVIKKAKSDNEKNAKTAVDKNKEEFRRKNSKGAGMFVSTFEGNVGNDLAKMPNMQEATSEFNSAAQELSKAQSDLGELNSLISDTESIESELEKLGGGSSMGMTISISNPIQLNMANVSQNNEFKQNMESPDENTPETENANQKAASGVKVEITTFDELSVHSDFAQRYESNINSTKSELDSDKSEKPKAQSEMKSYNRKKKMEALKFALDFE
jgi:hypothetical protein